MVKFEGTAWDTEDGVIADSALTWVDSDGSLLGTGSMLFITSLSPGWHTITLTATDSDGMSMSVNVTIRVGRMVYLPVVKR